MWWVVANEIHYTVNSLTYGYGCGKDRSLILIRYLPKHKSLLVCFVYCHGYVGLTAKGYVLASNNEIGWSFVVINVKMLKEALNIKSNVVSLLTNLQLPFDYKLAKLGWICITKAVKRED